MSNIKYLVNKYDKQRMPYENRGDVYECNRKKSERVKELYVVCEELFFECGEYKRLKLTDYQKKRVIYLVDTFGGNFKRLHGNAKKEAIILAFIFYVKFPELKTISLNDYKISSKYGLSNEIFIVIVCRLAEYYMRRMPVVPYQSEDYDHEILSRNGGVK